MADQNKYDRAYDEGYLEGKKDPALGNIVHNMVKGYSIGDEKLTESYNAGYDDGVADYYDDNNSHYDGKNNDIKYNKEKRDQIANEQRQALKIQREEARRMSSSITSTKYDDDSFLGTLLGYMLFAAAILWFATQVVLPLIIINIGAIGLISAFINKKYNKILYLLAIIGGVIIVLDYNKGWFTKQLVDNVSFFKGFIPSFLYINFSAGLLAAYFLIRNILNEKNPVDSFDNEFSKRNLTIMGSLVFVGISVIFGQNYLNKNTSTHKRVHTPVNSEKANYTSSTNTSSNTATSETKEWTGRVSTKEGSSLRMRELPTLNSKILAGVPDGTIVNIIHQGSKHEIIEGVSAPWYKIRYNNMAGWAWGGFLIQENISEDNDITAPISNLFKSWEELNLTFYMNQWDKTATQVSKKFSARNYSDILERRSVLFNKLSAVKVVNYEISEMKQLSANSYSVIVVYSMEFNFKDGRKITEADTTEKYILTFDTQNNVWKIAQNFDYID